jgi:hypothetical protein
MMPETHRQRIGRECSDDDATSTNETADERRRDREQRDVQ